ncbi:unnamed protein product [Rotaria sordida]|uniref:Uncharacterized protein n=1 Tax=Rotaria sordida TaxID=392033 RepID=A0A815ZAN3_9BILA|nr:unnamed protein product [Rotaria sordida]CAF1580817.1 unnamed protein product [Rotaria sordida]
MGYMDTYNLNLAEEYGYQAGSHILSETVRSQNPDLSEVISELMSVVLSRNSNKAHQYIRKIMQISQVLLSIINRNTITPSESTNEQTCTIDELIAFADHYRHQQDYVNAERRFTKALDKTTEINSKHVWNIYRKMTRMSNHGHYQDYFAVLYSKYDDDNPKHFQLISTIQIILYKLFLSENDFKTGFNCLIHGIVMKIKFIHHQTSHIDSRYILNLFYKCTDQEQIIKLICILTKLIETHLTSLSMVEQNFISTYFGFDNLYLNLAEIIHCEEIDSILNEIKSKTFSSFLHMLLQLLCQSIPSPKKSIFSLKSQILQFLQKYNDEKAPLFYLMKLFESLLINDAQSFLFNLEQLRLYTITFENDEKLREKLSNVFEQLKQDRLREFLQNILQEPIDLMTDS